MLKRFYILSFFSILAFLGIFFVVSEKQQVSISEKRKLAVFPEFSWENYFAGKYTRSINQYINDHFPMRQEAVHFTEVFRYNLGFRLMQEKLVVVKKSKKEVIKSKELQNDTSQINAYLDDFEEAYMDGLLIVNGKVYTLNSGSPAVSPYFSKMLNMYADSLRGTTRVFSAVAPLSSGFIPVSKYAKYNQRNKATLDAIKNTMAPGTYFCDVLGEMNLHFNENLWFGSDHHWTALGAYYGYVAFCKAAGFKPVPLEEMKREARYPYLGSLYELTRDLSVRNNPDTVVVYKPNVVTSAVMYNQYNLKNPVATKVFCNSKSYSAFICGDAPLIKITTNVRNGKKAAVVKNSMGNAFSVYLISHYEEIYVFDFRYSRHNLLKIIRDAGIDDLIFSLGMYGAMSHGTIKMMKNMATNKPQDYKIEPKKNQAIATDSTKTKPLLPTQPTLNQPIENTDTNNNQQ